METLQSTVGLPGLFLACLFSAALSTISSGLNSLAAVVLEDIIKSFIVKDLSDERAARLSKLLCIVFGVACLALTIVASQLGALLQAALSLFGVLGGPILGLFCLGVFIPFSNSKGAIVGTTCGLLFTIWIFTGSIAYGIKYPKKPLTAWCNSTLTFDSSLLASTPIPYREISTYEKFHSISYTWYGLLAVTVTMISGCLTSLLTGGAKKDLDFKLLIPLYKKIGKFLPHSLQKTFNCIPSDASIEPEQTDKDEIRLERVVSETKATENGHSNLAFTSSNSNMIRF
jgi:solute carrier family 5 (sodium-dependent multivitamin transporter), member 6